MTMAPSFHDLDFVLCVVGETDVGPETLALSRCKKDKFFHTKPVLNASPVEDAIIVIPWRRFDSEN